MGMILRSASIGAVGFGAAFALVGLYLLDWAPGAIVVGLGVSVTLALLMGRGSLSLVFSVASAWAFGSYILLPGGPLVALMFMVHPDERIITVLLRLMLLGGFIGVVS
jgi:hypothetical protein